ncbi:SdpI family protein [Clostridium novyi]|uniref:SdpI family protein n=1 Tax=Clostridium novyi TaxID=1542 RepID=UPI000ADF7661|nr:DUF1648 domain-containing protein [Clostridium novyi]
MKKKVDRTMIITTVVCLLPIIFSLMVYDKLPEKVPIHWNGEGVIDNYASKPVGAFLLPVVMAVVNIITNICLNNDPRQKNASKVLKLIGLWTIPCLTIVACTITMLSALGHKIHVESITPVFVGILIIICGNYLPKCKQNYTVGIKLPWTLNSEENWNKTHRLGGYVWQED